jgi:hypothetical protein
MNSPSHFLFRLSAQLPLLILLLLHPRDGLADPLPDDELNQLWIRARVNFEGEAPTEINCTRRTHQISSQLRETAFASPHDQIKSFQFTCRPSLGKSFELSFRYKKSEDPTQVAFQAYSGKKPWLDSFNQFTVKIEAQGRLAWIPPFPEGPFHQVGTPTLRITESVTVRERERLFDRLTLSGQLKFAALPKSQPPRSAATVSFDLRVQAPSFSKDRSPKPTQSGLSSHE